MPFPEAGLIQAVLLYTFVIWTMGDYSGFFYHSKHVVFALVGLWAMV